MPLILTVLLALNTLPIGLDGDGNLLGSFLLAVSPLVISFAFVLPACILIGLPATALLERLQAESLGAYAGIGIVAGFVLPLLVLIFMDAQEGWWTALLGAFSGGLTARTWWFSAREPIVG